jgi:Tfp pilus assembly protein PilN
MIKINLLPSLAGPRAADIESPDNSEEQIKRKGLTNLFVLLVIPIGLFVYALQVKPQKISQITSLNRQLAELAAFNEKEANIVAEIRKIKEDEQNVQIRIDALQKVTQGRTAEIQSLNLIRNTIKERMWIKDLNINSGVMSLVGVSQNEMDINLFQENLTRNVLLKNVLLEESNIIQIEGQNATEFKLKAYLEKNK